MSVDVNCNITGIIQNINSMYQYGVLSCEYEDSIDKFLQILHNKEEIKFCPSLCENNSYIVNCPPPINLNLFEGVLLWEDTENFEGNYRLEIYEMPSETLVSNIIIIPTTIVENIYSYIPIFSFKENALYKFNLYKICEEGIESTPSNGCASVLTIPNFLGPTIVDNTGYSVTMEFPDISGGILNVSLYLEDVLIDTKTVIEGSVTFTELYPETQYTIKYNYIYEGVTEICPLKEDIINTGTNPYRYYKANRIECGQEGCEKKEEVYLKVSYEILLEEDIIYLSLTNIPVTIDYQIFSIPEDTLSIEDITPIDCEWYCTCEAATGIEVESLNVAEDICETATIKYVECKNCNE